MVIFPIGATEVLFRVDIVDDMLIEETEDFGLLLTNASFGMVDPAAESAIGRIIDNDSKSGPE